MAQSSKKATSGTKLFGQDIVQKLSDPEYVGIVLRCWHDEDLPPSVLPGDPLMRPLAYGEVGVSFLSHNGTREILSESELRLVDRTLQPGDYCKRSFDDVRAGVVTNISAIGRVHHAISREEVEEWKSVSDLEARSEAEIGDYVAYDDWIGQVVEVFDEYVVQLTAGQLVRLPELGSRLTVGETGMHVLPPADHGVQNFFGLFPRLTSASGEKDTVLAVKHNTYAIAWLALNQSLDPFISENKPRPQRFWYGENLSKLTLLLGRSDLEMRLGDRVEIRNKTGLPMTQHGKEGDPTGVLHVQMFRVKETRSTVDILWQDGTRETLKATEIIPYLNPDEYDCWPGDYVVWKSEGETRPAIVQSVNAIERTASILFPDTGSIELASLLELDPHGNSGLDNDAIFPGSESFGVHLGDFVFIHPPGATNGLIVPRVPRIGEVEAWVRENPFEGEELGGWRKAMHDIGSNIAAQRGITNLEKPMQRVNQGDGKLSWCGEVTGLNLDGTVEVTHPDYSVNTYTLSRLTRLYDGIEQLEDDGWDEGSEEYAEADNGEEIWTMDESGDWRPTENGDDWEDVLPAEVIAGGIRDDILGGDEETHSETNQYTMNMDVGTLPEGLEFESLSEGRQLSASLCTPPGGFAVLAATDIDSHPKQGDLLENEDWKHFAILSSAPPDHAFFSSPPAQPSKSFLGRLRREYSVLDTSLPESILIRAYEDRTDLLRSLIIGPENTPYADAPFVIDWMLDSNFPHSPPIAHFLSWTNGNGRVNPNLYEEGKVCLSILGTWTGDKHEVWSSARSSLLQALVSIQGLVLVKEPWFCEPAYEKLRGTDEGTVNSRLYSEKAFVLSRAFVRRALEIPLGGLEAEITHLYHHQGRLQKVIDDAERLIEKSRESQEVSEEDHDVAVPRLTAGGIIALERTLIKLRGLHQTLVSQSPGRHDLYLD